MKTVNRNGLKFELIYQVTTPYQPATDTTEEVLEVGEWVETGRVVGIEVTIAPNAAISTPHLRTVEKLSKIEEIDNEMVMNCRINYYHTDGRLMAEVIDADTSLSPDAKAAQKQLFASYTMDPKSTRGSRVNPLNGNLLPPDSDEGVPEIMFFQNLTTQNLIDMGICPADEQRDLFRDYYMQVYMLTVIPQRAGI